MKLFYVFKMLKLQLFVTLVLLLCISQTVHSQKLSNTILATVGNHPITVDDFDYIFKKNSSGIESATPQDISSYLDLYINFRLKLLDAKLMGLDTLATYKSELLKYREQLIEPFLKDDEMVNRLAVEAYHRLKRDINASHILIQVAPNAKPTDTITALNKITEARNKIMEGASFESIALEYSQDPSVIENKGNLGYFTAFNMIYPFENICFNTNINEVSMPFRTNFGYHIVKINDNRPTKGELEVAHIMMNKNEEEGSIQEVYQKLLQGENFETLAKKYSTDQNSAINGGKLPKFRAGRLVKEFEEVAFNLQEGEVSKPFKSYYGWHIVKVLKLYPLASFEEMKSDLISRVQNDHRSEIINHLLAKKLASNYKLEENKTVCTQLNNIHTFSAEEVIFKINQHPTYVKQFLDFLNTNQHKYLFDNFKDFKEAQLINYHKKNLEKVNPEFAAIMQEYQDGLLLFEILQRKIWDRAEKDTIGLKAFYKDNADKYIWGKRVKGSVVTFKDAKTSEHIIKFLKEGHKLENIKKDFTLNTTIVDVKSGIFEEESLHLPTNFDIKLGISQTYQENDFFKLIVVDELLDPQPKTYVEAKGNLINDYQHYLEKQWIADLRKTYKVTINKKALTNLIDKYRQPQ